MIVINPFTVAAPAAITWNPADKGSSITLSNGNLTATGTVSVRATASASAGKKYFESVWAGAATGNPPYIGIADNDAALLNSNRVGANANSFAYYASGFVFSSGSPSFAGSPPTFTVGDVIGVAVDLTAGHVWFAKNGTWINDTGGTPGDPGAGTNPRITGVSSGPYFPAISPENTHDWTGHFAPADFVYSPPSGFVPW